MKLIKKLARMVEEEIHDADKYARCAMEYKSERPELSRVFLQLANAELEHAQLLHTAAVSVIDEYRRAEGEPPPGMLEAYDLIHEWQMGHVADVKSMIQSVRE